MAGLGTETRKAQGALVLLVARMEEYDHFLNIEIEEINK